MLLKKLDTIDSIAFDHTISIFLWFLAKIRETMERTSTPESNTRSVAEFTFAQFLQDLETDKEKLKKDLEMSAKINNILKQENVELKNQLDLAKKTKWCYICEKETKNFVQKYAICSENCLKKLW